MAAYYKLSKSKYEGKSEGRYYAKALMMSELHILDLPFGSGSGGHTY